MFLLLYLEYISPFHLIASLLPYQTKTNTNDYAALSVSRHKLKLVCKLENDKLPTDLFYFDIALNIFVDCGNISLKVMLAVLVRQDFLEFITKGNRKYLQAWQCFGNLSEVFLP